MQLVNCKEKFCRMTEEVVVLGIEFAGQFPVKNIIFGTLRVSVVVKREGCA